MTEYFDLPALCNCARIRRASRVMTRYYDSVLAPSGLGINQFTLLGYLRSHGPMQLSRLADLLAMDRATVGHNVRPLERDGLLELVRDTKDARVKVVALTSKGGAKLDEIRPLWEAAQKTFEDIVGSDQAASIRSVMDAISERRADVLAPLG
jgi:DNA-binding MarR family transcriptional regulator